MGLRDLVRSRYGGFKAELGRQIDKAVARGALIAIFVVAAWIVTWWRTRAQAEVTLQPWLAVLLAGLLAGSLVITTLYLVDRWRRLRDARRETGDERSRVEFRYGPYRVRVDRSLLQDRHLESGWESWMDQLISDPLCPDCYRPIVAYDGRAHTGWRFVVTCACGREISPSGRGAPVDREELALLAFEALQRQYRAGLPLTEGTQLHDLPSF